MHFGIDFGTTNTSVAALQPDGEVRLASFACAEGTTETFRSLLYLEHETRGGIRSWTGPRAIEHFQDGDGQGRLIQSLKSFLTSRTLQSTEVFGRRMAIEELIARILRDVREQTERFFGQQITSATVGRPVEFVGAEKEDDNTYAMERLRQSFLLAGYPAVHFVPEPMGAAYFYQARLEQPELLLIGDFGGGTSDFSLLRVGPNVNRKKALLGHAGVGLAGDAFDAKIVRNLVSPALGMGTETVTMGKRLPIPAWVYMKLEKWHHLSFLRARDTLQMLETVRNQAEEPERIEALIEMIRNEMGLELHQAVQKTKNLLSAQATAPFHFDIGMQEISAQVERTDFNLWIAEELQQISTCVDALLQRNHVEPAQVDRVYLTGGTSLVPAVREIFASRFGSEKLVAGSEFTSVAAGLARMQS